MNKKILISAFCLILVLLGFSLINFNSPESQLRKEVENEKEEIGPILIEEEFTGPNLNNQIYIDKINPDEIEI